MSKIKGKSATKLKSIRIRSESKDRALDILNTANKKKLGRKIKVEDLFDIAIGLVTDDHIKELQSKSLTNKNRQEILRQKYIETMGPITEDEFIGFTMSPDFSVFMETHKNT